MKNAADYLVHIKALIALNHQVVHWKVMREEAQGDEVVGIPSTTLRTWLRTGFRTSRVAEMRETIVAT